MDVYEEHGYDVSRIVDPVVYRSEVLTEGHLPLVIDVRLPKAINLNKNESSKFIQKEERDKKGFGKITYTYKILENETYNYTKPVYRNESYTYNATYRVNETGAKILVLLMDFPYYNITWDDCINETKNGTRLVIDHYETIEAYRYVWREIKKLNGLKLKDNDKIIVDIQGNFKASIGNRQVDVCPIIKIGENYSKTFPEYAWWNSNWLYSKKITIDHTKVLADETNFPVLISYTSSDFIDHVRPDGYDFRFVDATNESEYYFEIEKYVSGTGELIAWVNVPSLDAGADT
ncbi:unnamed protein product, partial [marine sediment metagenome]